MAELIELVLLILFGAACLSLVGIMFVPPRSWTRVMLFLIMLVVLVVFHWIGGLALVAFNYCEHNCKDDLNMPTLLVISGLLIMNIVAVTAGIHSVMRHRRARADAID